MGKISGQERPIVRLLHASLAKASNVLGLTVRTSDLATKPSVYGLLLELCVIRDTKVKCNMAKTI
jgi:hypothetical protein